MYYKLQLRLEENTILPVQTEAREDGNCLKSTIFETQLSPNHI